MYLKNLKKIKFILNGGRCKIGLESTIVSLVGKTKNFKIGRYGKVQDKLYFKKNVQYNKMIKLMYQEDQNCIIHPEYQ